MMAMTICMTLPFLLIPNVIMTPDMSCNMLKYNNNDNRATYSAKYILKPSSNRSSNIFTLVQKVKIGHTKRLNSKDKSRLCRDFAGYFISKWPLRIAQTQSEQRYPHF